jgi:D-xylose transport system substrate-binding protein
MSNIDYRGGATQRSPGRASATQSVAQCDAPRRTAASAALSCFVAVLGALAASTACAQTSSISANSFNADFSAMSSLKQLAAQGKGKIAVLLPETTTSARYTSFDAPYLQKAFEAAGLPRDQFIITNAQGSESTELTQAQSAISQGASVLLVDPISSGVGASIETYAKAHGVPVIDYDRLTLGGGRSYYVSFDNVAVGRLIGQGMDECLASWKVAKPQILVMRGAPTDNNATLFAQGYNGVLQASFDSGKYGKVGEPAGSWDPAVARTTFEQQYTAHSGINAVVTPNDDNANAVISYLKTLHVPPSTFPTTGQDATLTGLQNVLAGYQCGTVYKPIYLEAQAAAALALFLRAGAQPPAALVNGTTDDTAGKAAVPSVLLTPVWVTPKNMASTVVKDHFVDAGKLCAGALAQRCDAASISR